jgi:CRISPR-associated protein Cmr2
MIISLGPVQEFIASARRSRDLWFGSWLLSELSKAAAHKIVSEHDGDLDALVFPKAENMDNLAPNHTDFNVANKIVALVTKPPAEIGRVVQESVLARLRVIRGDAYKGIRDVPGGRFLRSIAEAQVEDLIEYAWASSPLNDLEDDEEYVKARNLVESLLGARKATRDFNPVLLRPHGWADNVPKSSLDGLRESVIHENAYDDMDAAELRHKFDVRKGERLCGVGLLKRHGNRAGDSSFFSTSHVAALPLLQSLTDKAAVDDYIGQLSGLLVEIERRELYKVLGKVPIRAAKEPHPAFGRYDGQLLFEEKLSDWFKDNALERAKEALAEFCKRALGGKRPNPYYALLLADGDRMGKAIDAQRSVKDHRALSSCLAAFAGGVSRIVETEHKGSLVYAGGDDVLAFVPLHSALPCARQLAEEFSARLSKFKVKDGEREASPTLSVGIGVAHHLESLSDALQLARTAEKTAKKVSGKNALAVIVSKRSGTDRPVMGKWGTLDHRLNLFVFLHRTEAIPDGAAYELHDLAMRLQPPAPHSCDETMPEQVKEKIKEARQTVQDEAIRILKRKRVTGDRKKLTETVLKELSELIRHPCLSVEQLANELIIARLFADATLQAGIKPEELPGAPPQDEPEEKK